MEKRDLSIDYARAVAVMMMVLQHVCIFLHQKNITVTYTSAVFVEIIIMITKSAVPLFVIITGSVLLNDEKTFSIKKGIKLSGKMICIILVWNVINAVYFYFADGLKTSMGKLIYGNYWYLYMLVALYLLMPIVNILTKNFRDTKIPLYVIFLTIAYELWLSYSLVMPEFISKYASRLVDKFQVSLVTGYTGLLLLGFLIRKEYSRIQINKTKLRIAFFCIMLLIAGLFGYSIFTAVRNNKYNYVYFDEFTAVIIAGIIFFAFLRRKQVFYEMGGRTGELFKKLILFIGTHSLGIYVVSNLILDVFKRLVISIESFPNLVIGIVTCWIMLMLPSCVIVWILDKTPLKRIV